MPFGGTIVKNHHGEHVAVRDGVNSVSAELFRTLRTNIRFMQPKDVKCPVVLVTSSMNGEGKSYVSTNLAISLTLLGKRVALVGLDIRKPMLATYMELPNQGCLTSYIAEDAYTVDDLIVPSGINNLDVLPSGVVPPNPSELLQSEKLDQLFVELRQNYDYVIVDTPPLGLVIDCATIAKNCDSAIMVISVGRIRYKQALRTKAQLEKSGCKILGVVLNHIEKRGERYYKKYNKRYYGKGYYTPYDDRKN